MDVAIALGIDHGGWCPAGRLSEDGSIPSRYVLQETRTSDYPERTEQNVIDSEATLILVTGRLTGGTRLTERFCKKHDKPHRAVRLDRDPPSVTQTWLREVQPSCLNVAGPRESSSPGIHQLAMEYLLHVFQ